MNNVDIKIVVELWQVVFAAIAGCAFLLGLGFAAATVFVRRTDCKNHEDSSARAIGQVFDLIRTVKDEVSGIKADVSYLKGQLKVGVN